MRRGGCGSRRDCGDCYTLVPGRGNLSIESELYFVGCFCKLTEQLNYPSSRVRSWIPRRSGNAIETAEGACHLPPTLTKARFRWPVRDTCC